MMVLFEKVHKILKQGEICDSCLGQIFADDGHGLTNGERGRSLKVVYAMKNKETIKTEMDCWICLGESFLFDEWAASVTENLNGIEFETYKIGSFMSPLLEENGKLLREIIGEDLDCGESLKTEMNREVGKLVGDKTGKKFVADNPDVMAMLNISTRSVDIQVNPIFIYGRYRKMIRGIPQTRWPCGKCKGSGEMIDEIVCKECNGSGKQYEESVQELIADRMVVLMQGRDCVFHGAGREDIDAKMLGNGRPFVMEIKFPNRRFMDITQLEIEINQKAIGKVEVELQGFVSKKMVAHIKELPAAKTYRARVKFSSPVELSLFKNAIEKLNGIEIEQMTPTRVAHRRANKMRLRKVYSASGNLESETEAMVEIHGEKGLYIKELVSGDGRKTRPSLSELIGVEACVESLDVTSVIAEDQDFIVPEYMLEYIGEE
jgi:tRNA pseudouridine synthase 10